MKHETELLVKHKVKLNASLTLRQHAECFILCIVTVGQRCDCFKGFTHKYFDMRLPTS